MDGDLVQNIKQYIQSIDFSRYCDQITQNPTNKIINKFGNWFTLDIGTPLLSLDSTYQFLLTTEYLFWWDDCEGYGYLPLEHVEFYTGEDDFDGVYVMDKDWDNKGCFIIDDDITHAEKKPFIEDMTRLITYILRQKNAD